MTIFTTTFYSAINCSKRALTQNTTFEFQIKKKIKEKKRKETEMRSDDEEIAWLA
jgi:hypothetical protein